MHIEICSGEVAAPDVDALYEKNDRLSRAKPEDLFFIVRKKGEAIAAVRFCEEEGTPLLRSMIVDKEHRRQGIGHVLLIEFERYLNLDQIRETWCMPYKHLVIFYAAIGFKEKPLSEAPAFLQERAKKHNESHPDQPVILMKRD